jgi:hypothetical protein
MLVYAMKGKVNHLLFNIYSLKNKHLSFIAVVRKLVGQQRNHVLLLIAQI